MLLGGCEVVTHVALGSALSVDLPGDGGQCVVGSLAFNGMSKIGMADTANLPELRILAGKAAARSC